MIPALHLITDDEILADPEFDQRAAEALAAGGPGVALHLRGPHSSGARLHRLAQDLLPVSRSHDTPLLINDRIDIALIASLNGVQLGMRSLHPQAARGLLGKDALIGASVHSREEASSRSAGADFLIAGTIFQTSSHPGLEAAGVERILEVASASGLPVIAIGGITPERVGAVVAAGVHGVAVCSGVWSHPQPAEAVRRYREALERS